MENTLERRLLLTSNGLKSEDLTLLRGFMQPEKAKVGIIPNACKNWQNSKVIDIVQGQFRHARNKVIVDLETTSKKRLAENVEKLNVIYVCGGDIFRLQQVAQKSGFSVLIKRFIANGGMYIGSSAGSLIAGPNIEIASIYSDYDGSDFGFSDFSGFALTREIVAPHYNSSLDEPLQYFVRQKGIPVIGLPDNHSLFVQNGRKTYRGLDFRLFTPMNTPKPTPQCRISQLIPNSYHKVAV